MPQVRSVLSHINVQMQRHACRKCHSHMMLARIASVSMGFDLRTFECLRCNHVREVMVETDAFGR
jgi:RNase P subunit RPR2